MLRARGGSHLSLQGDREEHSQACEPEQRGLAGVPSTQPDGRQGAAGSAGRSEQ